MGSTPDDPLTAALQAPGFGGHTAAEATAETEMRLLRLDELKAYDRNPRQADNPAYVRLKASIRAARALNTPLTVTRRPGEACYMVAAGGNSRLQALKELYAETRDAAFAQVTCRFQPWTSESQVMVGHLIENDVRGNMTFIDKARAVVALRDLYTAEAGDRALTQRELKARLDDAGFGIALSLLNTSLLAVEHLYPLLPQLLDSGLGVGPVRQLLRLWRATIKYVELTAPDDLRIATSAFAAGCAREDQPQETFTLTSFQASLALELGARLDREAKLVALDIDGLLHGVRPPTRATESDADEPDSWTYEATRARRQQRAASTNTPRPDGVTVPSQDSRPPETPVDGTTGGTPERLGTGPYSVLIRLATRIAAREGLNGAVEGVDGFPGFRLSSTSAGADPGAAMAHWVLARVAHPSRVLRDDDLGSDPVTAKQVAAVLDGTLWQDETLRDLAELLIAMRRPRQEKISTATDREVRVNANRTT